MAHIYNYLSLLCKNEGIERGKLGRKGAILMKRAVWERRERGRRKGEGARGREK